VEAAELAAVQIAAKLVLGAGAVFDENVRSIASVQQAADTWLATYGELGQLRSSTRALYADSLRKYVYPRFGSKLVTALKRGDIRDLVADLLAQGRSKSLVRNVVAPLTPDIQSAY